MDLIATGQDYWEALDSMAWWIRLIVGLVFSIIAAGFVQVFAHGPIFKLIKKTSSKYDDILFELAKPLINS